MVTTKKVSLMISIGIIVASIFAVTASAFTLGSLPKEQSLAYREIPLENRNADRFVSDVMKDNILLNAAYMSGKVTSKKDVNWDTIRKPFVYEFTLNPGQVFAYHDQVLPEYRGKVVKTTNARFNFQEGFKSDGYLYGDGVCHFASIIYWAAKEAKLKTIAPSNHNFAVIPNVPREYGVAILYMSNMPAVNAKKNLYVENTFDKPVTIRFRQVQNKLSVSINKVI